MTDEALKPCPFTAVSRLYRTIEPTYTRIGLDATNSPGFRSLLSNVETIRAALEKAAAYDRIKPLLDELVEARKKATFGLWDTNYTGNIWGGDWSNGDPDLLLETFKGSFEPQKSAPLTDAQLGTAAFICLAANLIASIAQEVGDDG